MKRFSGNFKSAWHGLHAGDVVCVASGAYPDMISRAGTVVVLNSWNSTAGVMFSGYEKARILEMGYFMLHDLCGYCESNSGWWLPIDDLTLCSTVDEEIAPLNDAEFELLFM